MNGESRGRSGGPVPPRWLKCPRKSDFFGHKFLVFKTPLDENFDDKVPAHCRFHPSMILEYMKMQRVRMGLWIDLTNTDRFYDKSIIEREGIRYVKMPCRGHGETPNEEQIKLFIRLCQQFIEKNPDDFIGVHCTHGFNRSGFLVSAFLVEECDWSIHTCILQFSKARPPGIYKQDYIQELCRLYGASDDPIPEAPPKPDWCFEDEQLDDDGNHLSSSEPGSSRFGRYNKRDADDNSHEPPQKRRKEFHKRNPEFMKGVSGVYPITDKHELSRLQRKVQSMCEWNDTGFPGSQPVSMDLHNIQLLAHKPYMVSWKADGTRYMMLIEGKDEIYFIDRDNCVFKVEGITFVYKKNFEEHLYETLVDGEMVIDKVDETSVPRYLIYDIIKFRGEEVGKVDFRIRLNCIRDELVEPRYKAMERGLIDRTIEPFGIRFKTFWYLEDTEKLLDGKFAKELLHEPDGLVFQPTKDPYLTGRNDTLLKWKPPELNSVDFRLKIVQESGPGLIPTKKGELYVGGFTPPFSQMKVTKAISGLSGKIIECKFANKEWVFLRERTDKSFPNAFSTAKAVLNSILNPVTKECLLDFIRYQRYKK